MVFGLPGLLPKYLRAISATFDKRLQKHGDTAKGVLWINEERQQLRFEYLARILADLPPEKTVSINDYGCGYGALYDFLLTLPGQLKFKYRGYDISKEMIRMARNRIRHPNATFHKGHRVKHLADYTFVSGTFNLKIGVDNDTWNTIIKSQISDLWNNTTTGMAFNMLDVAQEGEARSLYYADAIDFTNYCASLGANVELVRNDPLEDWTILMKRQDPSG